MNQYYVAGRLGAPHGIKGLVRVQSFLEQPERLAQASVWYFPSTSIQRFPEGFRASFTGPFEGADPDTGKQLKLYGVSVQQLKAQGAKFVGTFAGLTNRNDVEGLANLTFYLPLADLPELDEDEFYWRDLIGLNVLDAEGQIQGKIQEIMETGANDVLVVVSAEGQKHLVPYLPDRVVHAIDLELQTMTVDWDFSSDDA